MNPRETYLEREVGGVEEGKERVCLMIGIIVDLIVWSRKTEKW